MTGFGIVYLYICEDLHLHSYFFSKFVATNTFLLKVLHLPPFPSLLLPYLGFTPYPSPLPYRIRVRYSPKSLPLGRRAGPPIGPFGRANTETRLGSGCYLSRLRPGGYLTSVRHVGQNPRDPYWQIPALSLYSWQCRDEGHGKGGFLPA